MSRAQTDMFNDIYELWKNERKQIINICSASKHYPVFLIQDYILIILLRKKFLEKYCSQIQR